MKNGYYWIRTKRENPNKRWVIAMLLNGKWFTFGGGGINYEVEVVEIGDLISQKE